MLTVTVTFFSLKQNFCQRECSLENFILTHFECGSFPHFQMYFCVYTYTFFNRETRLVIEGCGGCFYNFHILGRKSGTKEMKYTFKLAEQYLETFHSYVFSKLVGKKVLKAEDEKLIPESAAVAAVGEAGLGDKSSYSSPRTTFFVLKNTIHKSIEMP